MFVAPIAAVFCTKAKANRPTKPEPLAMNHNQRTWDGHVWRWCYKKKEWEWVPFHTIKLGDRFESWSEKGPMFKDHCVALQDAIGPHDNPTVLCELVRSVPSEQHPATLQKGVMTVNEILEAA
jgi:hypothetical protein